MRGEPWHRWAEVTHDLPKPGRCISLPLVSDYPEVGLWPSYGQRDTGGSLPGTAERDFPLYKKQMMKKSPGPAPFLLALDPVMGGWEAGRCRQHPEDTQWESGETGSPMTANYRTNPVTSALSFHLGKDHSPLGISSCSFSLVLLAAPQELKHRSHLGFGHRADLSPMAVADQSMRIL